MKHVFVGDIHGKIDLVKRALDMDGKKVFIGDYMDSFDRSNQEHDDCLRDVFNAVLKDEAIALVGNHELSYMHAGMRCSGYRVELQHIFNEYSGAIQMMGNLYYRPTEDVLVTHAGLGHYWWWEHEMTLDNLSEKLDELLKDTRSDMYAIGRSRGGFHPIGGIFWLDWEDEFEPIVGLTQIVGHTATRSQGFRRTDNGDWNIDCLDSFERGNTSDCFLIMDL